MALFAWVLACRGTHMELSISLRHLSGLLLQARAVPRQHRHTDDWYTGHRRELSGYAVREYGSCTLAAAQKDDVCHWMVHVYCWTCYCELCEGREVALAFPRPALWTWLGRLLHTILLHTQHLVGFPPWIRIWHPLQGLAIPGVVGWLLQRFGFKIALRAYATAIICASGPGLFLIRPRVPDIKYENVQSAELRPKRVLEHVARSPHTYILALAVFIQGLGFFIPNLYIASFSSALGLPTSSGAGLLALISLSQVLGQISQGWASDHVNIYIPLSLSALLPGLGAIFLWGPAKDMSRLVPFAILWGLFSSSYSVLLPGICSFLAREVNLAGGDSVTMLLYGILSFERGLANILEGPVSSWLLGGQGDGPTIDKAKFGLGQYAAVVWFTSICMFLSSMAGFGIVYRRARGRS
jgi:hypothetical protein